MKKKPTNNSTTYTNLDPESQRARRAYEQLIQQNNTPDGQALHRDCVLLVEDDKLTRRLVRQTIGQLAPRVDILEAENGAEGLAALAQVRRSRGKDPVLIIADLIMPQLDGWAFVQALQRNHQQNNSTPIPVIVFSGSTGKKGLLFKTNIHKMKSSYGPLLTVSKSEENGGGAGGYDGYGIEALAQYAGMLLKRVI